MFLLSWKHLGIRLEFLEFCLDLFGIPWISSSDSGLIKGLRAFWAERSILGRESPRTRAPPSKCRSEDGLRRSGLPLLALRHVNVHSSRGVDRTEARESLLQQLRPSRRL